MSMPAMLAYEVFYIDVDYWATCPVPLFPWFLLVQMFALTSLAIIFRVKNRGGAFQRFTFYASLVLVLTVIVGTVQGLSWYKELTGKDEEA